MAESFSIGDLARLTGTKIETIRYYESIGLLPSVARTSGNYRRYARPHLERLSFIRRGRDLGFSLEEVRELLRRELKQLIDQCGHGTIDECRIIEALAPVA